MSRSALIELTLNGASLSADTLSLTYTDNSGDEIDDLSITIQNRDKRWMEGWFPNTGDQLTAKIITSQWTGTLDCGSFILDDVDVSGWPLIVNMKALAMPVGSDFVEVTRSKSWEKAKLQEIASSLTARSGIALQYEATYNPLLAFVSQADQTDQAFLCELCAKYGLTMKAYSNKVVIYDMAELEQSGAAVRLTAEAMMRFSARSTITDAGYSGCTVQYQNKDGQLLEYTHSVQGTTEKVFRYHTQIGSLAEAERVAKSKLRELNMGETTFTCALPGNTRLAAGVCVEIAEFGNFDGHYIIDKATHKVGGGYTTDLELHRIL